MAEVILPETTVKTSVLKAYWTRVPIAKKFEVITATLKDAYQTPYYHAFLRFAKEPTIVNYDHYIKQSHLPAVLTIKPPKVGTYYLLVEVWGGSCIVEIKVRVTKVYYYGSESKWIFTVKEPIFYDERRKMYSFKVDPNFDDMDVILYNTIQTYNANLFIQKYDPVKKAYVDGKVDTYAMTETLDVFDVEPPEIYVTVGAITGAGISTLSIVGRAKQEKKTEEAIEKPKEKVREEIDRQIKDTEKLHEKILKTIKENIGKVTEGIKGIVGDIVRGVTDALSKMLDPIIKPITDLFSKIWSEITKITASISKFVEGVYTKIKDFLRPLIETITDRITKAYFFVKDAINKVYDTAKDIYKKIETTILGALDTTKKTVEDLTKKATEFVSERLQDVMRAGIEGAIWTFFNIFFEEVK